MNITSLRHRRKNICREEKGGSSSKRKRNCSPEYYFAEAQKKDTVCREKEGRERSSLMQS